jgi:hypothetical protein
MIIKVFYNKNTKQVEIHDDVGPLDNDDVSYFNPNTFVEDDDTVSFEIGVNTSYFEQSQKNNDLPMPEGETI